MLSWISQNLATILISFALILIIAAIIIKMVRGKKNGSSSCSGCPMCGSCHKK